jgi:Na+-transporting methylmalonyl-CoA/oxaloacetate decarboxylase gamma subunit
MQVILLLIIGVFLMYRMMRVEDRMNKMEHDMIKYKEEIKDNLNKESDTKSREFKQFSS